MPACTEYAEPVNTHSAENNGGWRSPKYAPPSHSISKATHMSMKAEGMWTRRRVRVIRRGSTKLSQQHRALLYGLDRQY